MSDTVSQSQPRPSPARTLLIANLLAAIGFGLVAMTICIPSMPQWRGVFDASQANVQLTFSAYVIALGVAQVFYGPLSDRYGRRTLLISGFALACAGSSAAALAPDLVTLALARLLQGAGAAAGMVIGRAMVQDYFSGADRPRVMAYIGMVMGLCPPLATIIGGQVHVHFGWRANFVVTAVLAAGLMFSTWRGLPPAPARTGTLQGHWLSDMFAAYARLVRLPEFLAFAAILSMCTGTFYVFLAGLPTVLAAYGVGPGEVGWYIMFVPLSYIVGNFLTSRLIRRSSEIRLMFFGHGAAICGTALVLVLALAEVRSPLAVAAPLFLLGFGHGLLMPSTLAGTVSLVPALAGAAAAAAGLAQQLFGAFGGYVVGLVEHDSAANLALLLSLFMLTSLFSLLMLRRAQTAGSARPPQ